MGNVIHLDLETVSINNESTNRFDLQDFLMNRKLKYWLFFLLLSIILFFLDQYGYLKIFHLSADWLVVPVKRTTYQSFQKLILKNKLEKDLKNKKQEIISLTEEIKILKEENRSLRKQLETPLPPQWEYLDAKVIGFNHGLTIDKGKNNQLTIGQIVLIGSLLVGQIREVSQNQSLVYLPTDSSSKIPVYLSQTKAQGILVGQYGTKAMLINVLQEDRLVAGDLILTTGEAGFPRGLLIGKISKINKKASDIYQQAEVELLLSYPELETVFVLVKDR